MPDMIFLLPCPMCGGVANMVQEGRHAYYAGCEDCGVQTTPNRLEQTSIDEWNARVALAPIDERAEFEKCFGPKDVFNWRNADDTYKNSSIQGAWLVWQARAKLDSASGGQS